MRNLLTDKEKKFIEKNSMKMSYSLIAKLLCRPENTIKSYLHKNKIKKKVRRNNRELSASMKIKILADFVSMGNNRVSMLASKYDLTEHRIRLILNDFETEHINKNIYFVTDNYGTVGLSADEILIYDGNN